MRKIQADTHTSKYKHYNEKRIGEKCTGLKNMTLSFFWSENGLNSPYSRPKMKKKLNNNRDIKVQSDHNNNNNKRRFSTCSTGECCVLPKQQQNHPP